MKNIGPVSQRWLAEIDIFTQKDLYDFAQGFTGRALCYNHRSVF